jgi:carboxylesterase
MKEAHRVKPGAEPYRADGGPLGALLLHGFSGSPASLRPMGEFLASEGLSVELPRLPGHGTHWEDLTDVTWEHWYAEAERAFGELRARCQDVVVVALSMGGSLGIHLTAQHQDEGIRGLALINPYVVDPRLSGAGVLRLVARSRKGVINDIKKPGQDEVGYERMPVRVLPSLGKLLKLAQRDLPQVRVPVLFFRSPEDHVVKASSMKAVTTKVGTKDVEVVELRNSYHVATLDHDADLIERRVLEFARKHATAP